MNLTSAQVSVPSDWCLLRLALASSCLASSFSIKTWFSCKTKKACCCIWWLQRESKKRNEGVNIPTTALFSFIELGALNIKNVRLCSNWQQPRCFSVVLHSYWLGFKWVHRKHLILLLKKKTSAFDAEALENSKFKVYLRSVKPLGDCKKKIQLTLWLEWIENSCVLVDVR